MRTSGTAMTKEELTFDIVLQGGAGDKELVRAVEAEQGVIELRFGVLESMSLESSQHQYAVK